MKAIVALSGGLDSATVLAKAIDMGREVMTVGFDYGSKHGLYEQMAATEVTAHYGVYKRRVVDLTDVFRFFKSNLLLDGGPIPEGHYQAETMKQTVVPCRNLIFLSIMAGMAQSEDYDEIWMGVHAGDHPIYPDCRKEFFDSAEETINWAMGTKEALPEFVLMHPFNAWDKAKIVKWGIEHNVPYHLTRTCYSRFSVACGKCGSCQERLEAFKLNGVEDPIEYVTREILPK